jgi:hypothetical protein
LNRDKRFRKPLLYPVELRGQYIDQQDDTITLKQEKKRIFDPLLAGSRGKNARFEGRAKNFLNGTRFKRKVGASCQWWRNPKRQEIE